MSRSPSALHARAIALANASRLRAAEGLLAEAQAAADDPDLTARIIATRALVRARLGDVPGADGLCRDAFDIEGVSADTRAVLAGQAGAIAEYAGRLDEAQQWLDRAIAGMHDPVQAAQIRMNRSVLAMQRGRLAAAADDAAAAASAFDAAGMTFDAARARHNLGYVELLRGDLVAGLRAMEAARSAFIGTALANEAVSDMDRAEVLRDAGLTREAERLLTRAAHTLGAARQPRMRADAEFTLARSLLTHDPQRAAAAARSAARRFRRAGNEISALRADALRLRAAYAGGVAVGDDDAEHAAVDLEAHGFTNEAAALRLSRELWRARQPPDPDRPLRPVRPSRDSSMDVRLLAHEVRAARASRSGRHAAARRHAAAGLDTLARWQHSFGSLDLQTSAGMHGAGLVFAGLDAATRSGRPDALFEWSERARHLSQQVVPLRPPPDPALAAELAELRQLRADNPTDDWLTHPRAAALRDSARERQWSGTGSAAIQERIDIDGLRAVLDGETALVAYVYSGTALTALVVTRDRATVLPLHDWPAAQRALPGLRADLDMSASVRSGPMAEVVRRSLVDCLAALSAALLDAPAAAAGTRRLVITVPGVLNGIPWAMLPAMRGRTFTLAASATRWASLRDSASLALATAGFAVGPRVARGDEEVDAAASAWPSFQALRGAGATVDAVTELAAEVDLLHVAAHGRHAVDNPLFSGLELSDGALFGYDIDRMPQVPATVVLSACEVGRSSVRWGEEAIGMTRVWLHAGTRAVVATPVVVADDEACDLLGAMHAELAAGLPAAEALAAASTRTGIVAPFQTHGAGF